MIDNFDPGKMNEILNHSYKEHPKISEIAKFNGEMLLSMGNIALRSLQIFG